eukprot:2975768-Pleurochrysis_carterae.AAC.1
MQVRMRLGASFEARAHGAARAREPRARHTSGSMLHDCRRVGAWAGVRARVCVRACVCMCVARALVHAEHLPKHEVDDEDGRREDQRDDDHRVRVAAMKTQADEVKNEKAKSKETRGRAATNICEKAKYIQAASKHWPKTGGRGKLGETAKREHIWVWSVGKWLRNSQSTCVWQRDRVGRRSSKIVPCVTKSASKTKALNLEQLAATAISLGSAVDVAVAFTATRKHAFLAWQRTCRASVRVLRGVPVHIAALASAPRDSDERFEAAVIYALAEYPGLSCSPIRRTALVCHSHRALRQSSGRTITTLSRELSRNLWKLKPRDRTARGGAGSSLVRAGESGNGEKGRERERGGGIVGEAEVKRQQELKGEQEGREREKKSSPRERASKRARERK